MTVTSKSKEASLKYASNFKNSNNNGKLPSQSSIDSFVKNENNKSTFSDFDTNENNKYIPLKNIMEWEIQNYLPIIKQLMSWMMEKQQEEVLDIDMPK